MLNDNNSVTLRFCEAWQQQDLPGALAFAHPDIVYAMFIPEDVVPFGGETRGKPAMSDRMTTILEQFAMLRFEVISFRAEGDVEHTRGSYAFRHRQTDETITGVMRIVSKIESGLIRDWKEFHDLEKVRAFMRLIAYKAVGNSQ